MQDQPTTENKPLSALREGLFKLDFANDLVLDAERELAKAKQQFADKVKALGAVWLQASDAAEKMGEKLPGTFREGGLLITFDDKGVARADRLPVAATSHELYTLASKAGE